MGKATALITGAVLAASTSLGAAAEEFEDNQIYLTNPAIHHYVDLMTDTCRDITTFPGFSSCLQNTRTSLEALSKNLNNSLTYAFDHTDPTHAVDRANFLAGKLAVQTLCINPLTQDVSGKADHAFPRLTAEMNECAATLSYVAYGHYDLEAAPNDDFSELLKAIQPNIDKLAQTPIP